MKDGYLCEIYETLKTAGLLKTKADFSVNWLRRSQRYYSYLASTGSVISVEALAALTARLEQAQGEAGLSQEQQALIEQLAGDLAAELRGRALRGKAA